MSSADLDNIVNKLTDEQKKWLNQFGFDSKLRMLMGEEEIKMAKQMVKLGVMEKGKSHCGHVQYTVESFVRYRI